MKFIVRVMDERLARENKKEELNSDLLPIMSGLVCDMLTCVGIVSMAKRIYRR